ncbi:hypothetical protein Btru_004744 [Bulinus truncatus]|nr:hypothetical protein Btru_004744 [Bulinus truncatus]
MAGYAKYFGPTNGRNVPRIRLVTSRGISNRLSLASGCSLPIFLSSRGDHVVLNQHMRSKRLFRSSSDTAVLRDSYTTNNFSFFFLIKNSFKTTIMNYELALHSLTLHSSDIS